MKIVQSFEVSRPPAEVWALFQDVPTVAGCMPGAQLTADKGDGNYAGKVNIKLGPFGASFEGEARVVPDPSSRSAHLEGSGLDRRGGSRSKLVLDYRVSDVARGSRVDIVADVQLAGPIAQFGRTAVVTETAGVLISDFARNVEQKLLQASVADNPEAFDAASLKMHAASPTASTNQVSVFRIFRLLIASFFARLVGRKT